MVIAAQRNTHTQPIREHKVFNNWNVVAEGWYIVFQSNELKKGEAKSLNICGQHLVFYRGQTGEVYAMDGYCPHMGVDFGIGKVIGEDLQCFFHHWKFNKEGQCVSIPCQTDIPKRSKVKTYACLEKVGFIWVHPNKDRPTPFLEIPALRGHELEYMVDPAYYRSCHHHITMINGIDPQHLKTVHGLNIEMNLEIREGQRGEIDIELQGQVPETNFKEKMMKSILGKNYAYSMNYGDGCLAGLTIMKDVKLFDRFQILPTLHMYFAYRPIEEGKTLVWPIYVTKKRRGPFGKISSYFWLFMTKMAFKALQGEDGEVYENIRFNPENLLPLDRPVAKYIAYINRLTPSVWSKNYEIKNDDAV